ncbi:MAG: hypothetical protein LAT61_02690 [Alcanivorax sp.]|nr:hypothetical protein [Alcanivorax sp.]
MTYRLICLLALTSTVLVGCEREPAAPTPEPVQESTTVIGAEHHALARAFEDEAAPWLRKLVVAAPGFREAVRALLRQPDDNSLDAARNAWTLLYESYNRAWPILATRSVLDPTLTTHLERTDIWPLMPGYVDAMPQWPESGIIYDATVDLDIDSLLAQQDMTDPAEVTVGFQVLELLLFGLPGAPRDALDLTLTEPLPDHQQPEGEQPQHRRRDYLDAISALLLEDLNPLMRPQTPVPAGELAPALLEALSLSRARQNQLDALTDADDPDGGEYLSQRSRTMAMQGMNEAMAAWSDGDSEAGKALADYLLLQGTDQTSTAQDDEPPLQDDAAG